MNASDYQHWMERAFLYVEAALSMELATPSRVCMSEEYLRSSFVRGLSHSKPEAADRVSIEWAAPWTDAVCWRDGVSTPGQGRKVQHDVRVNPEAKTVEAGLACEVKWLKQAKSEEIVRDIWKLALSRGKAAHGQALRCYLLVGGEGTAFKNTTDTLRSNHLALQWRGDSSATVDFRLGARVQNSPSQKAIKNLLAWSNSDHARTPPQCLKYMRCVRRASWYRTLDGIKWRMGLWELTSHSAQTGTIDWDIHKADLT
ncbi:MAG: hypothetical protein NXI07_03940 [bacterium]|nr:hypothetical protein [bacterium]